MNKNFLFAMLAFLLANTQTIAQSPLLTATVAGNSVTIVEPNVVRNCGSMYDMHVYLQHDTLFWYQVDTGATAVCLCTFSFTVTVDSLAPGVYTAMVYDVTCPDCPQPSPDTVFEGTIGFVITEPLAQPAMYIADQDQSDCIPYSATPENQAIPVFTILPLPGGHSVRISTSLPGEMKVRLIDMRGVSMAVCSTSDGVTDIDTSRFPSGIYLLECRQGSKVNYFKVAK